MALQKKKYTKTILSEQSHRILERLEQTDLFRSASRIALYHALPGEVQTAGFIEKWHTEKTLYLPAVEGDDLRLLPYRGSEHLKTGSFGIFEPTEAETSPATAIAYPALDLIIVPGIAFDRHNNRLGRGKGYYDRLLAELHIPKIGICFDFQLFDAIPTEPFDKKMNLIISEKETTAWTD